MKALISPEALHQRIQDGEPIRLIDATYGQGAMDIFLKARIGDAVYFDIDDVANSHSPLPHTLPTPALFAEKIAALGVRETDTVVVYAQGNLAMAAARCWWMFRTFGHQGEVRVLNGSLALWQALGHPVNYAPYRTPSPAFYRATFNSRLISDMNDVRAMIDDPGAIILDARSAERFAGLMPEPRGGMRAGHIPGSHNLPFESLLNPSTGQVLPLDNLRPVIEALPVERESRVVASCGSGVTACVIALAFHEMGRSDISVYDGSWAEWGSLESDAPLEINSKPHP